MRWRTGIGLAFIVAAAVLAYQIGARLSDEAVLTIVGVMCGILASIPISIGLLVALTRERTPYGTEEYDPLDEPAPAGYEVYRPAPPPSPLHAQLPERPPQIIVVAPPQAPSNALPYPNYLLPAQAAPPYAAPMQERNFKIVGEDEGD
jgi:hypothetical protein